MFDGVESHGIVWKPWRCNILRKTEARDKAVNNTSLYASWLCALDGARILARSPTENLIQFRVSYFESAEEINYNSPTALVRPGGVIQPPRKGGFTVTCYSLWAMPIQYSIITDSDLEAFSVTLILRVLNQIAIGPMWRYLRLIVDMP
jgi:hypothetical protein